ncbi:hypothetical protein [Sulfurospirillum barnesii]|uniref:Uncharacterized protein n=1 Tax=Sulfurospirillum barnesii (strain ATCC 700032 / DSM 10660 / SES-3) TaxID=760154 RepID=I3XX77_SULBS|nr:hypothetical protein [Sulfurospirillum barnesii]AFL68551.1 hypothetical protein Sulba_1257 [Sulfurospirillum barnesii SES-3]
MNTSINFNPVNSLQAGAKVAHVFRNHNLNKKRVSQEIEKTDHESGAIILQPYEKSANIDLKKQGTSKITKNLSVYRKRYQVALEKGDLKTAERNKNKVELLEKELQNFKRARRGREASLVEASWSITKFPPVDALNYDEDILIKMKDIALKILQSSFPELDIDTIGVAGHTDQASIHIHTIFDVPDNTTFSRMMKNKTYGAFQQEFNDAIREKFSGLPIEKITPNSKKYIPLMQYKKENPIIQLKDNFDIPLTSVDSYKENVKTLENENVKFESLIGRYKAQKQLLEATVKSKEELLKTQVSRNELLEKSNENLKTQLENMKALNKAKEDENVKLQEELKISRELLKEAQRAQEQSKENDRLEAGKPKNIKRAEYTKPLDKKEVQKALDNAPDGSASSSRLRLVLDGKMDFSKIKADTPEAIQIIDNAKADFEALEEKGLLTCNKGVYTFSDDQAKSVIYKMKDASVQDMADEYYAEKGNVYKGKSHNKQRQS